MPVNYDTLNRELHELLRSRNYDPISLDSKGDPTDDVEEADVFRFHFKDEETGDKINAWATVEGNNLVLYIDDKFTEHKDFETFAHFLKRWSQRKLLGFDVSNKDRLLGDMKKRTVMNKKENMLEGYHPMGKKASYSDNVPEVKIILQHTRQIEEGEQRFRNIAKIFVENLEGERFLLPTNRPGLARVYARHIAEGGTPYDDKGRHITTLVEEYSQMAGFVRATRNGQFNESALALVNEGLNHYNTLRMTLQGMASHRGYNKYFESYTPVLNEETDDDISLNELFVQETLDPRIENVMPILKRLSKNVTEMTAVKELDEWAESITEVEDETTKTLAEPADEMLDEAPGAMSLKHNQDTEKSNLKAFDLDEEGIIDKVKKVGSKVFDKLGGGSDEDLLKDLQKKAGIPQRAQHGKPNMAKEKEVSEGFSPSQEVADQIIDSIGGESDLTSDDVYRAVEEYQNMMDNPHKLDTDEVVQIVMDRLNVSDEVGEGVIGNMVNKAKSMFTKQAPAAAAPAPAAPVVPDAAAKARMAAAPQGYDPNTGKPQVAAKAAPGAVKKGGTMDMTKKVTPVAKPAAAPTPAQSDYSPQELAQMNKDLAAMDPKTLAQVAAKTDLDPTVTAAVKAEVARRKGVAEDLDADQKRVGQLGPTEKVKNNNIGKLVGANESVELSEMDKSQPSSDRGGESSGNPYAKGGKATPIKAKDAEKDAEKALNKSMDKAHKKDVKEGQDDLDAILRIVRK
jgi:hypothetical protein